jgi:hypothetical protein
MGEREQRRIVEVAELFSERLVPCLKPQRGRATSSQSTLCVTVAHPRSGIFKYLTISHSVLELQWDDI